MRLYSQLLDIVPAGGGPHSKSGISHEPNGGRRLSCGLRAGPALNRRLISDCPSLAAPLRPISPPETNGAVRICQHVKSIETSDKVENTPC